MDEDFDLGIKKIVHFNGFGKQERQKYKKNKKKRRYRENKVKDHFEDLTQSAERIHKILKEKKSPYRFCIYRDDEDIFIDLVILDANGKIQKTIKKDITHQEFSKIILHIETLDGVLVDYKA